MKEVTRMFASLQISLFSYYRSIYPIYDMKRRYRSSRKVGLANKKSSSALLIVYTNILLISTRIVYIYYIL